MQLLLNNNPNMLLKNWKSIMETLQMQLFPLVIMEETLCFSDITLLTSRYSVMKVNSSPNVSRFVLVWYAQCALVQSQIFQFCCYKSNTFVRLVYVTKKRLFLSTKVLVIQWKMTFCDYCYFKFNIVFNYRRWKLFTICNWHNSVDTASYPVARTLG